MPRSDIPNSNDGSNDRVVPFSGEDAPPELRAANVAGAEAAAASDGGLHGPHGEAAPSAAWKADVQRDFAWRHAMDLKMRQDRQVFSEEETALIAKGLALLDNVAAVTGKAQPLKHSKTITSAWTQHDKKSGLLIGHVEATIRA